jgi:hypothetical protein
MAQAKKARRRETGYAGQAAELAVDSMERGRHSQS